MLITTPSLFFYSRHDNCQEQNLSIQGSRLSRIWSPFLLTSTITATVAEIPYLSENIVPHRGKILAVVTSAATMGKTNKRTGYELTELARAYYTFKANGFDVKRRFI